MTERKGQERGARGRREFGRAAIVGLVHATTREDAVAWLARNAALHEAGNARRWVIVDREGARPIGDCMLFNFDERSARAEIGFVLGRRDWVAARCAKGPAH